MSAPAERMRQMRERRRKRGLRDVRIIVPDARLASVRRRVAAEVARLIPGSEDQALSWIEAVSEFDAPDRQASDETR
jgi:Antitoxin MazE-like